MIMLTIGDVASYVAEELCGPISQENASAYRREYGIAYKLLVQAVERGEIPATKVKPLTMPILIGSGVSLQHRPSVLEWNYNSEVSMLDAARVIYSEWGNVPYKLLQKIPPDVRGQFDQDKALQPFKDSERQKLEAQVGLLITAIVDLKPKTLRKPVGEVNVEGLAALLSQYVDDGEGRALHGWGESTLKGIINKGIAAFKVSIET